MLGRYHLPGPLPRLHDAKLAEVASHFNVTHLIIFSATKAVLNGLGGPKDSPEGAGGGKSLKMSERQLLAEMLRGAFPAIDVPTFNQADCRRAALFHYDRASDAVFFRHFVVGRRQLGLERGIKKLTRFNRLPNLGRKAGLSCRSQGQLIYKSNPYPPADSGLVAFRVDGGSVAQGPMSCCCTAELPLHPYT
eukprot:Skav201220  [mRNA]  locus=scaffold651:509206:523054:- [translate_table: standard]